MNNDKTLQMVHSALFTALIFIGTQFIRIPLPFGYFNFGDCFIILSAIIIGNWYAIAASAIGAVLADVLSGYTIYAPATLVIKSLMVISIMSVMRLCKDKHHRLLFFAIGAVIAELIMVCGYFIYDTIVYHFAGAVAALPGNIIQGVAAVITSTIIIAIYKKGIVTQ